MKTQTVRALYSFPLRLGADRICYTAWQQVSGLAAAGADLLVFPASLGRPLDPAVRIAPTLARGRYRLPYRILGTPRSVALHDWITARRLEKMAGEIDIVHAWPTGALQTLKTAARLGIPTVLERPNANTRVAMLLVKNECQRLGVALPPGHEHAYDERKLHREEQEYEIADRLLCPSDFVVKTFLESGYSECKLVRHQYGFDEKRYFPGTRAADRSGLSVLFAGVCAVRKGLHYALEAWLASPASARGTFLIAGEFLPAYRERLDPMLSHPSVKVLGHRKDLPELMRNSDILVLPSIEEGSALVTSEARGSGCVLLVSEAAGAICSHMQDALVHRVGDVPTLTRHFTMLDEDRALLERLRSASLADISSITWTAAGARLLDVYRETIAAHQSAQSKTKSPTCDAAYAHAQAWNG